MSASLQLRTHLSLLLAVILWSTAFVGIRAGLKGYSPGALALFRFSLASACFALPYIYARKRYHFNVKQLVTVAIIGLVGIAGYSVLLNSGERSVASSMASFIVSQTPVITATLAILFLRERPDVITLAGIAVSCFGVSVMILGEPIQIDFNVGLILIMIAATCGSLHSVLQKPLYKSHTALEVVSYSTWFATLALLVFTPELVGEVKTAPLDATLAVVYLGIIPSTLAQWCWGYGLSQTLVVNASSYLYAMPILSTLFGWLWLGEIPSQLAVVGGSIALLGAAIVKKDVIGQHLKNGAGRLQKLSR